MAVMRSRDELGRAILRTVLTVVVVALALYLIYRLRQPISWLVIAAFIAVAMSGPVNLLQRRMKRGLAIALAYGALILIPIGLGALLIPNIVGQVEDLASNVPEYAQDVTDFVNENQTLNDLNEKYDFTSELQSLADDLPSKIKRRCRSAPGHRGRGRQLDLAAVTILILSIFMVGGGPRWAQGFVRSQPADHRERIDRALRDVANAIGTMSRGHSCRRRSRG